MAFWGGVGGEWCGYWWVGRPGGQGQDQDFFGMAFGQWEAGGGRREEPSPLLYQKLAGSLSSLSLY